MDRLRQYGISKDHIDAVIEIARHIRDEAAQSLDESFDAAYRGEAAPKCPDPFAAIPIEAGPSRNEGACCTPTASEQACC